MKDCSKREYATDWLYLIACDYVSGMTRAILVKLVLHLMCVKYL